MTEQLEDRQVRNLQPEDLRESEKRFVAHARPPQSDSPSTRSTATFARRIGASHRCSATLSPSCESARSQKSHTRTTFRERDATGSAAGERDRQLSAGEALHPRGRTPRHTEGTKFAPADTRVIVQHSWKRLRNRTRRTTRASPSARCQCSAPTRRSCNDSFRTCSVTRGSTDAHP